MSKSKIRHLFDGTRPLQVRPLDGLDGASETQILSREMILPAYKAAISAGPPSPTAVPLKNRPVPEQTAYPAQLAKELLPVLCKTNPIFKKLK